jgi:transcriptional regulator GlxA family with amidase domain
MRPYPAAALYDATAPLRCTTLPHRCATLPRRCTMVGRRPNMRRIRDRDLQFSDISMIFADMNESGIDDRAGDRNVHSVPHRIDFFLVPRFSMMAFTAALEPLRVANLLRGREVYRWQIVSRDGGPVAASSGIAVPADRSIEEMPRVEKMFVCASHAPEQTIDRATLSWLRRLPLAGVMLGAIDTGAWFLARAGLLDGHRATVHWEWQDAFAEKFPDVEVCNSLFEIDRGRLTCAGGTAALDMMLQSIGVDFGQGLAADISEQFIHERIRVSGEAQRMVVGQRLGVIDQKLEAAIAAMEQHLEEPLRVGELAERARISERQLERIFRHRLDSTPTRYYLNLRLRRARILLGQTHLPVREVAVACGFASPAHFSRTYRAHFGNPPRLERG